MISALFAAPAPSLIKLPDFPYGVDRETVTQMIEETWIKEVLFTDLKAIRVPTLIIHGIHDKVVPFQLEIGLSDKQIDRS